MWSEWAFLGLTHQLSAKFGWGEDPAREEARAEELAYKALAIDPSDAQTIQSPVEHFPAQTTAR